MAVVLGRHRVATRVRPWHRNRRFFVRFTSGLICAPLAPELADRLELPLMVPPAPGTDPLDTTAYTVSVDTVGTGSGISTADRALTLRTPADPGTQPAPMAQ
ncbi:3,4-dihydroxy-2-butanone-4-phosphate synthase [Streptomyces sp. NPDC048288]|uniref:3,4-dihydroxy-2-butanone-4-phosphate synthase n=1 Tax=Streptomyces sp. NPDC048288 TaxID=3365529 RepID=UPI003719A4B5